MMMAGNKDQFPYQLNIWDGAKKDIEKLDGAQLVFVKKGLKRIKQFGLNCGSPLHGKLMGYRKLKNRKMGLRIVFGQSERGDKIEIIDIVAVGKRSEDAVYQTATMRVKNNT
ncbi:MAG: addiction module toxin RelE [Lactobacillus sp.]|jgi:mRNA interferase RelE/StbE|nr:addiction module toxin RelE [Lactobacillus sp.]